ncbi:MAG: restriction endonuclease subunit S [Bacteroidales bacterium]|nr:restriction endonuclease subunit S [Bacteroidales bacterium]
MKLIPLYKLFTIQYGNSFDLNVLEVCDEFDADKINYVSRTRENNGVSAFVEYRDDTTPYESGLITVAGSGNSVLESFIQQSPFYTGYHVFLLRPIKKMSDFQKLFYCYCIRQNQYKYSFGRQANKTLKDILVPKEIPEEFISINLDSLNTLDSNCIIQHKNELKADKWEAFPLKDLFKITGSKTTSVLQLEEYGEGEYPYITTQATKNGIDGFYDYYTEDGNVLTVDSAVIGYCSYQKLPFSASDHVEKLVPKFEMNKFIALFLVTIINTDQYRYNYGRKCSQTRMEDISIKLPSKNGVPDFDFMENYMKSLPYSSSL